MAPLNLSPGTAAELLGISYQTLKYWREVLDPRVKHARYSGREILAYSVIKSLIREQNYSPEKLSQFPMNLFFELMLSSSLEDLKNQILILNANKKLICLKPELTAEEIRDRQTTFLHLDEVIDDHFSEFANR
jgi:DNA-binding transcriptional MerR regulator